MERDPLHASDPIIEAPFPAIFYEICKAISVGGKPRRPPLEIDSQGDRILAHL